MNQRPAAFLLRFAMWAALFEAGFFLLFADGQLFQRYLELHAWAVGGVMRVFGVEAQRHGAALLLGADMFEVARGCDVTRPIGLLAAAILAFPASAASKALAIAEGIALLFLVNLLRICSLILVSRLHPELFKQVHLALWPMFLILMMLWFWVTWARRHVRTGSQEARPLPG